MGGGHHLWWRSIARDDHVYMLLPLGLIESPPPGVGPIPNAQPLINPVMSVDPPDPRDAKRRCLSLSVNSMAGKLGVAGGADVRRADTADFDWQVASISPPDVDPWFAYKKSLLGFAYVPKGTGEFGVAAPFWFLIAASGIATELLWGGHLLHFTTRGLLIAMTLIAWVLGLGVILTR